jgi:hypothetical protein
MGFFTKPTDQPTGLAPLSKERITAHFDANDLRYGVDDDGDIGAYFDGHPFYFFVLGDQAEYLQTRARWNRRVDASELDAVLRLVNEWNTDKLWPKGYARVEGDTVGVYGEHSVDYEHGLTDDQLGLHIPCSVSTTLHLFTALDDAYPAQAAAAVAELEQD